MAAYGHVLAQNIRAARSRKGLGQALVAERMKALGYQEWRTQTVSATEKGRRRVLAEEILGLALALETSISGLMAATPDDRTVDLAAGPIEAKSVERLATGFNDHAILWKGDVPVRREVLAGWAGDPDMPAELKDAFKAADYERELEAGG
jgi:transcriptional regulator with XRE-family HTH domain